MKITVQNLATSGQSFTLCDDDDGSYVSGFWPADTQGFRVVFHLHGGTPDIWDNFNDSSEFTLKVYREHADAPAATRCLT